VAGNWGKSSRNGGIAGRTYYFAEIVTAAGRGEMPVGR